jgi:hypothetical protein
MQRTITIRIKAIFLLVIFSLNSIMGFACSIGLNLGYNRHHHVKEQESSHAIANEYTSENLDHCGAVESVDTPDDAGSPAKPHDCCKDEVLKFTLLDKSVSSSIKIDAPTQFALDVAAIYFLAVWNSQHVSTIHYYVQSDHPPISRDIRIAMQSFQI